MLKKNPKKPVDILKIAENKKKLFEKLYINYSSRILVWLFFINAGAAVAVLTVSTETISFIIIIIASLIFTIGSLSALFNAFHQQKFVGIYLKNLINLINAHKNENITDKYLEENMTNINLISESITKQRWLNTFSFSCFILGCVTIVLYLIIFNCQLQ